MSRNQYSTNRFIKSVYSVGYLGDGDYKTIKNDKIYNTWHSMLRRCYSKEEQIRTASTYINCFVDERWHNFQTFAIWYLENYIDGYALDKDILIKGNKIYSPENCCFVPTQINVLIQDSFSLKKKSGLPKGLTIRNSGNYLVSLSKFGKALTFGMHKTIALGSAVYKFEKEKYIKEVADIWKDKISEKVYIALYNYEID